MTDKLHVIGEAEFQRIVDRLNALEAAVRMSKPCVQPLRSDFTVIDGQERACIICGRVHSDHCCEVF